MDILPLHIADKPFQLDRIIRKLSSAEQGPGVL
jgi:hypothetical protein